MVPGEFVNGEWCRYDFKPSGHRLARRVWRWWRRVRGRCWHNATGAIVLGDGWCAWQCSTCRAITARPRAPYAWEADAPGAGRAG